jgi:hypothetical protein
MIKKSNTRVRKKEYSRINLDALHAKRNWDCSEFNANAITFIAISTECQRNMTAHITIRQKEKINSKNKYKNYLMKNVKSWMLDLNTS